MPPCTPTSPRPPRRRVPEDVSCRFAPPPPLRRWTAGDGRRMWPATSSSVSNEQSKIQLLSFPPTTRALLTDARCLPFYSSASRACRSPLHRLPDLPMDGAGTQAAFSHPSPSIARLANHHSWREACRHVCRRCSRGWMARPP